MSPETFRVFCGVFAVWGLAVTIKAIVAIRTAKPYTFSIWDGGMLRAGKSLSPLGTKVKAGNGVLISIGCVLVAAHLGSREIVYAFIGILAASVICDLVFTAE